MRRRPLLLLGAAALPSAARARCTRPLRVGVSLLGWGVFQEQGKLRGIVPDLVERLGQHLDPGLGCSLQLMELPRARVLLDFLNGNLDLFTSAQRNSERDEVGDFLPYAYSGFDLALHPDEAPLGSVQALQAHPRLRLGLVRGIQLSPRLMGVVERMAAQHRVEWATDFRNLAARLQADRFRGAIFPSVIHGKLKRDGHLPARFGVHALLDDPPLPIGVYLNRQRLNAEQRQALSQALRELVREGEVERIYSRYLGAAATQRLFAAGRAANP